jgi:hypothetical protein
VLLPTLGLPTIATMFAIFPLFSINVPALGAGALSHAPSKPKNSPQIGCKDTTSCLAVYYRSSAFLL